MVTTTIKTGFTRGYYATVTRTYFLSRTIENGVSVLTSHDGQPPYLGHSGRRDVKSLTLAKRKNFLCLPGHKFDEANPAVYRVGDHVNRGPVHR